MFHGSLLSLTCNTVQQLQTHTVAAPPPSKEHSKQHKTLLPSPPIHSTVSSAQVCVTFLFSSMAALRDPPDMYGYTMHT